MRVFVCACKHEVVAGQGDAGGVSYLAPIQGRGGYGASVV